MKHYRWFTLIEMLVVITIIAILSAMLMTPLRKAQKAAQSSNCLNNLKQTGILVSIYTTENNNIISLQQYAHGYNKWTQELLNEKNLLPRYFFCPANKVRTFSASYTYGIRINYFSGDKKYFRRDPYVSTAGTSKLAFSFRPIISPSKYLLLGDSAAFDANSADYNVGEAAYKISMKEDAKRGLYLLHSARGNYLFCDGHVKSMSGAALSDLWITRTNSPKVIRILDASIPYDW